MSRTIRWICLCTLLLAVGLQAGCEFMDASDRALVQSFVEDWLRSKNMHPTNEDGSVNWLATLNIGRRAATGRSGDTEVDAVLDAYEVLSNLHQADKLMEQGREERNPELMDQAIGRRPGDWTYRTSRAALALYEGDQDTYAAQQAEAEQIVRANNIDPAWYHRQSIQDLDALADEWQSAAQCKAVLNQMITHFAALRDLTGEPAYAMQVEALLDQRDLGCR